MMKEEGMRKEETKNGGGSSGELHLSLNPVATFDRTTGPNQIRRLCCILKMRFLLCPPESCFGVHARSALFKRVAIQWIMRTMIRRKTIQRKSTSHANKNIRP